MKKVRTITAVLVGAGGRGAGAYAPYALSHPDELKIVAVAEPDGIRREKVRTNYNITKEMCFESWEDLIDRPQLADTALICTQDRMHYEPAIKLMGKGYHLLLEKPMATDPLECIKIAEYAEWHQRKVCVCHVLRYTPFFSQIKNLIMQGRIGKIIAIQHNENVGYWHQAMSYVRGPWRRSDLASPMILAKCCHDMDIILWLTGSNCKRIASYGSLSFFRKENAPKDAPEYCQEGCPYEAECPWYAPRFYLKNPQFLEWGTGVDQSADYRVKMAALRHSTHGRCVFQCDNDVVDHQVAIMELENDITVAFTMCAFTNEINRTLKIMGTKGELRANMVRNEIEVTEFVSSRVEVYKLQQSLEGHAGGDEGLMRDFVRFMQPDYQGEVKSSARVSLQSHLMAFAAEKSRLEGITVQMDDYVEEIQKRLLEDASQNGPWQRPGWRLRI